MHKNDLALIRQLNADAASRVQALTDDDIATIRRRSNLAMVSAIIGEVLARQLLIIDDPTIDAIVASYRDSGIVRSDHNDKR